MRAVKLGFILLFSILAPAVCAAQLSQLTFDSRGLAPQETEEEGLLAEMKGLKKADSIADVVESKQVVIQESEIIKEEVVDSGSGSESQDPDSRASLAPADDKLIEVEKKIFLLPAKAGPDMDDNNSKTITSFIPWQSEEDAACSKPADTTQEALKSRALENIVSRLTGGNEFRNLHCMESCDIGSESRLSRLTITDMKGGAFRIVEIEGACAYQLEIPEQGWEPLEVGSVQCLCR